MGCIYKVSDEKITRNPCDNPPEPFQRPQFDMPLKTPDNFAFSMRFGIRDIINTFKGTYTKDMVTDPDTTIPFQFTQQQMDSIYAKMLALDFFNYPLYWSYTQAVNYHCWKSYKFVIQAGNVRKDIYLVPKHPLYSKYIHGIDEIQSLIKKFIYSSDTYRKSPEPRSIRL
jgi:hypothetical protein